ncbi:hypothetical protein ACDQ55_13070 [Chitinophaga sp. 30R24]|uniref:hypothetical protein n=1 Tax=Chitinophaga sp. 30R24 TaxID=3248838 RepID=UPI003B8F4B0E
MENDILIDFKFTGRDKPRFSELFLITGQEHPKFPARNKIFAQLEPLGFEQLEDFFGILNGEETGDDVLVWLFPMINGEEALQSSGPFDAIRLSYSVLRNDPANISLLQECFDAILQLPDITADFDNNTIKDFAPIQQKADEIIAYWRQNQVEPGSAQSLLIEEEEEDWEEDEDWEEEADWEEDDEKEVN